MKEYFARIPFGQEQRLNLGFGNTCPVCDVQRGIQHADGCMAEECPKCYRPVVDCYCECLAPWDEFKIVQGIKNQFTSLDDARKAGSGAGNRKATTLTPTDKAALSYFMRNSSPETRAEIDAGFKILFPDLEPCGTNENGERMYSSVDIAKALGADINEVNESISAMVGNEQVTDSDGYAGTIH